MDFDIGEDRSSLSNPSKFQSALSNTENDTTSEVFEQGFSISHSPTLTCQQSHEQSIPLQMNDKNSVETNSFLSCLNENEKEDDFFLEEVSGIIPLPQDVPMKYLDEECNDKGRPFDMEGNVQDLNLQNNVNDLLSLSGNIESHPNRRNSSLVNNEPSFLDDATDVFSQERDQFASSASLQPIKDTSFLEDVNDRSSDFEVPDVANGFSSSGNNEKVDSIPSSKVFTPSLLPLAPYKENITETKTDLLLQDGTFDNPDFTMASTSPPEENNVLPSLQDFVFESNGNNFTIESTTPPKEENVVPFLQVDALESNGNNFTIESSLSEADMMDSITSSPTSPLKEKKKLNKVLLKFQDVALETNSCDFTIETPKASSVTMDNSQTRTEQCENTVNEMNSEGGIVQMDSFDFTDFETSIKETETETLQSPCDGNAMDYRTNLLGENHDNFSSFENPIVEHDSKEMWNVISGQDKQLTHQDFSSLEFQDDDDQSITFKKPKEITNEDPMQTLKGVSKDTQQEQPNDFIDTNIFADHSFSETVAKPEEQASIGTPFTEATISEKAEVSASALSSSELPSSALSSSALSSSALSSSELPSSALSSSALSSSALPSSELPSSETPPVSLSEIEIVEDFLGKSIQDQRYTELNSEDVSLSSSSNREDIMSNTKYELLDTNFLESQMEHVHKPSLLNNDEELSDAYSSKESSKESSQERNAADLVHVSSSMDMEMSNLNVSSPLTSSVSHLDQVNEQLSESASYTTRNDEHQTPITHFHGADILPDDDADQNDHVVVDQQPDDNDAAADDDDDQNGHVVVDKWSQENNLDKPKETSFIVEEEEVRNLECEEITFTENNTMKMHDSNDDAMDDFDDSDFGEFSTSQVQQVEFDDFSSCTQPVSSPVHETTPMIGMEPVVHENIQLQHNDSMGASCYDNVDSLCEWSQSIFSKSFDSQSFTSFDDSYSLKSAYDGNENEEWNGDLLSSMTETMWWDSRLSDVVKGMFCESFVEEGIQYEEDLEKKSLVAAEQMRNILKVKLMQKVKTDVVDSNSSFYTESTEILGSTKIKEIVNQISKLNDVIMKHEESHQKLNIAREAALNARAEIASQSENNGKLSLWDYFARLADNSSEKKEGFEKETINEPGTRVFTPTGLGMSFSKADPYGETDDYGGRVSSGSEGEESILSKLSIKMPGKQTQFVIQIRRNERNSYLVQLQVDLDKVSGGLDQVKWQCATALYDNTELVQVTPIGITMYSYPSGDFFDEKNKKDPLAFFLRSPTTWTVDITGKGYFRGVGSISDVS